MLLNRQHFLSRDQLRLGLLDITLKLLKPDLLIVFQGLHLHRQLLLFEPLLLQFGILLVQLRALVG